MRLPRLAILLCLAMPGIALAVLPPGGWDKRRLNARDDHLSVANAINNQGRVVGTVEDAQGARQAVIFEGDSVRAIGTLGGMQSDAYALSGRGDIAGSAQIPNGYWHAYVRATNGTLRDLGTLGGYNSSATSVNSSGQAAGYADTPDQQWHAFYDDGSAMHDIGTLGGEYSAAMGINKRGQVVGLAQTRDGYHHAFVYSLDGGIRDLGTLGGRQSAAYSINDQGNIVGVAETAARQWHAFVVRDGKMEDLGAVLDGRSSAISINNYNQILGTQSGGYRRSFVYELDKEVRYLSGDSAIYQPRGMNDRADIVGSSLMLSKLRAAVLYALPGAPGVFQLSQSQIAALLLAAALLGALALRQQRAFRQFG